MKRSLFSLALVTLLALPSTAQYALQFGGAVVVADDQILVGEGRNLLLPGSVFVYETNADGAWVKTETIMAPGSAGEADGFGSTLTVSGATLVVGASKTNTVYVFARDDNGVWRASDQLTVDAEGFGSRVAVDNDNLLVGAPGGREAAGTVYTFRRNVDGTWRANGELTAEGVESGSGFGSVLAIDGEYAAVGAPRADSRTGATYAFQLDPTGAWRSFGEVRVENTVNGDRFGSALLISGHQMVVGMPGFEQGVGAVAIFQVPDDTTAWIYDRRVAPFDAKGGEQFGSSLAFDGSHLWAGAPGYRDREGMVYRYQTNPETGRMAAVEQIRARDLEFRSSFGNALAVNEGVAVVAAVGHDNFEGAAFPFSLENDTWVEGNPVYNDSGQFASVTGGMVECRDDTAGDFPCSDVDMLSFLSRSDIGADRGIQVNDVWGWEDPETEHEYALIGRTDGMSIVDLTDPYNPIYVGSLPKTKTANQSLWRDIKVYKDHAFIVADGAGAHHMQVFDLRQLRDVESPPVTFEETAIYKGVYSSHNIVINEDTGFAYAVGSDSGGNTCGGALHMINIQDPSNPTFAGCFADTRTGRRGSGATHDAQCVVYHGPDDQFQGREICLSSNGTALSIADVTDKKNPVALSIAEYPNVAYTHQGWLTDDHRYFYLNDEGDEVSGVVDATRTIIVDVTELDEPVVVGEYLADHSAIDHNLYVKGNLMYQTNYVAGLRILDISNPEKPVEVGHFDTVPYGKNDSSPVLGAWSNYPFFKSGVIVITSGREGVFFVKKKAIDT